MPNMLSATSRLRVFSDPPPEFITHLNYVRFLNSIPLELVLRCNLKLPNRIPFNKNIQRKVNLVKLTLDSLNFEQELIHKDPGYALTCVPWISVKSYYLLFYLLQIARYLITGQEISFSCSHKNMLDWFKKNLKEGSLEFNLEALNELVSLSKALAFKSSLGSNLKYASFDEPERYSAVLKLLARYKLDDFKILEKLQKTRTKVARDKINKFKIEETVTIFDFFYCYRIKANYRDLDFLEKAVDDKKLAEFYCHYFILTEKFCTALKKCINDLAKVRFGKEIF